MAHLNGVCGVFKAVLHSGASPTAGVPMLCPGLNPAGRCRPEWELLLAKFVLWDSRAAAACPHPAAPVGRALALHLCERLRAPKPGAACGCEAFTLCTDTELSVAMLLPLMLPCAAEELPTRAHGLTATCGEGAVASCCTFCTFPGVCTQTLMAASPASEDDSVEQEGVPELSRPVLWGELCSVHAERAETVCS